MLRTRGGAQLGRIPNGLSGRISNVPPPQWNKQADAAKDHPPLLAGTKQLVAADKTKKEI